MKLYFAGGLNEQQTPTLLECIEGYNFELGLKQSKLVPRKPLDLKGTAPNASSTAGILQLVKRDNTETTLVQAGSTVYLWDGGSTWTSKGSVTNSSMLRGTYWSLGDYLVITDLSKTTVVKKWEGTTLSTLTTGLGASLFAKYGVVHEGRVWLANVTTSTDTPHLVVASRFEDPTSYDTTVRGSIDTFSSTAPAFYLLSPDLKPINWMGVFQNILIISTEGGRLYQLEGSSPSDYRFVDFYVGSAATGTESAANIGNDVIYMKQGGGIDLLSSTQKFGDVAADDLSRWIPNTVMNKTGAIVIYDQVRQKVFFFVTGKVLVLFKDLIGAELSPWSVYSTQQSFNFATSAAAYIKRPGTQQYSVYFGDSVGRIFDLNGSGAGDAGVSDIQVYRKTRFVVDGEGGDRLGHGALDFKRKVLDGILTYRRVADACSVTIGFDWGDEYNVSESTILMKGAPAGSAGNYYGGVIYYSGTSSVAAYYSLGSLFARKISSQTFSPTGKGPGCFVYASLSTSTDFQIDSIELQPPKTRSPIPQV